MGWMFRSKSTSFARTENEGQLSVEADIPRLTWGQMCEREDLRGHWLALDECVYDENTGGTVAGALVDVDHDLSELCLRIRDSRWKNCAIIFCSGEKSCLHDSDDPFSRSAH